MTGTSDVRGAFVVSPGSPLEPLTKALEWLWRPDPALGRVGFALEAGRSALEELIGAGELSGAIVFAEPERRAVGEGRFADGMQLRGDFGLLPDSGETWVRSSLGTHATASERVLTLAAPADGGWGTLRLAWVAEAISRFCEERLGIGLRRLPPVGCLRLDDIPGTAEFQLEDRAKDDATQLKLAKALTRAASDAGAVLNVAVACRALGPDKEPVPLEEVWPEAVKELRAGVERGAIEPVCHGWLGLVPDALERGEVDFHEYGALEAGEAEALLRQVVRWQRLNLGAAETFVAVDWTYGTGTRLAASSMGLVSWLRPSPGPLVEPGAVRETLAGPLEGLAGVDFSPLSVLARAGVPPTVTLHGRSLDRRRESFDLPRDAPALAKAMVKRDIFRLLELDGVKWLGANAFAQTLAAHGTT